MNGRHAVVNGGRKQAQRANPASGGAKGLSIPRLFTNGKITPFDEVEWEHRSASITNEKGEVIFRQDDVEVPKNWSQTATNIVASKYFHGKLGTKQRESSARQLISRVVDTVTRWGEQGNYFPTSEDRDAFRDELTHLLVQQKLSFNSPVWFNVGVQAKPQCSACFINSLEDSMHSIMDLAKTEGMLFKWGSGTGTNFSVLRSCYEGLSGGGIASGPVSFMRGFDAFAGVIKSGGKTRRAAKMVILNIDHPDIMEFIECKAREERKAWKLISSGYDSSIDGEAYSSIFYQNANHSVRVTDEFMRAVEKDGEWWTRRVTTGEPLHKYRARDMLRKTAESAYQCGDPGMQYDTTINRWHTCKNTARINASNPCSEYMFLDDTACNLASLNLMKFLSPTGQFDAEAFRHAVDISIMAQEILVDNSGYPTPKITQNSHDYRPLGLGYANLGALLMSLALPYDSDAGREIAAAITALMTGEAYLLSARIAQALGPFPGFERNREPMLEVIGMHREAAYNTPTRETPHDKTRPFAASRTDATFTPLLAAARKAWDEALEEGRKYGYRNSQVTVLAPTGTIGFMMDCDTTGIEPDLALVKFKKLVGGGVIKIVNHTVPTALVRLGYSPTQVNDIVDYIDKHGTIEGAPHLQEEHLAVFDCSLKPSTGSRAIFPAGHIQMMAAVQPFLSGAISKTVNLPAESTVADIMQTFIEGWKLGLKAIAIYRDSSKRVQPLSTADAGKQKEKAMAKPFDSAQGKPEEKAKVEIPDQPELFPGARRMLKRRKLPTERQAITHKFSVGGHDGYITVGLYEDGAPGEIFITMAKEGSTLSGIMDAFATAISISLQYGVPLRVFAEKFAHMRFEPSGWTGNAEIPYAKSIMDYIFRWLGSKFISPEYGKNEIESPTSASTPPNIGETNRPATGRMTPPSGTQVGAPSTPQPVAAVEDAPTCADCGSLMFRNGNCYKCENCGSTSGCS